MQNTLLGPRNRKTRERADSVKQRERQGIGSGSKIRPTRPQKLLTQNEQLLKIYKQENDMR